MVGEVFEDVTKVFFPRYENPIVLFLSTNHVAKALRLHYESINKDIKHMVRDKYNNEGYLYSLLKRRLKGIKGDPYRALINEGLIDIQSLIDGYISVEIIAPNGIISYHIVCEQDQADEYRKEINQAVSKWLRVPANLELRRLSDETAGIVDFY